MTEETLFELARKTPEAERAALLDRACLGKPELRARVEALLAADAASSPLSKPSPTIDATTGFQATASFTSAEPSPGIVIAGRYTLEQKLGEGGMGEVWVAKQSEPVKRRVALKLIKAGMDSKSVLQRFEQERQALAMMDHPHIAKVLDGGLTADRRPYFVMELVNGLPLNKFCDEAKLGIRERLELFVPICQAVQHAHQKGIVHRDLKPSNILVTMVDGNPVPKVIDFGVAKAMGGKLTDESMSTQFGAVIGTLEYMSPEQAGFSNQDVDTRADIYSLGVILYELLTGLRPFDGKRLKQAALDEVIRIIREEEPSKPSTKLSTDASLPSLAAVRHIEPGKLTALLRGELDWVVMKCLEKQRERRYETANGLARDIQRYMANETVEARPPSARYRLRKFVQRNKGTVIAASLVAVALLAGVVGTSVGLYQANLARDAEARQREIAESNEREANEQRAKAEAEKKKAVEFRDKALDAMRATTGTDVEKLLGAKKELTANEKAYLEAIAKRWQIFAKQEGTDEQSRAIASEGHLQVACLWQKLGRGEEARPEYERAVAIVEKLVADFPAVPVYRRGLAICHNNLGLLLDGLGKLAEAEEQYRKALALHQKLAAEFPAVAEYRLELAGSHNNLGLLLAGLGKLAEAEEQYRKALALQQRLAAEFPAVPEYRSALAGSHNNLGNLLAGLGKRPEAEELFRKALALQQKLAVEFPAVPEYRSALAMSHTNLGRLLRDLGQRAAAEEQHRKALALQQKLATEFPAVPDYRSGLALSHSYLGNLLVDLGQRAVAEEQHREALAIRQKLATEFPAVPEYRGDLAKSHSNLGNLLADLGQRAEAEEQQRKALAIEEKLAAEFPAVPEYRGALAKSHYNLGCLLIDVGKRPEAEEQYRKGLAILEKLATEFPAVRNYQIDLGGSYCNIGFLVKNSGKPAESLTWFDKAIKTLRPVHEAEPRDVTAKLFLRNSYTNRAAAYTQNGRHEQAVADRAKVFELSDDDDRAEALIHLGCALDRSGDAKAAAFALDRSYTFREAAAKAAGSDGKEPQWQLLLHLIDRGKHEAEMNRREEAIKWFTRAIDAGSKFVDKWPSADATNQLRWAYQHRADNLGLLGKQLDALRDWNRVIELSPVQEQPLIRARRAQAHVHLGKVDEGIQEATELRSLANTNADIVYQVACIYSIASGKVADKKQVYCDTAMELLQQAVKTGWTNATHMKQDSDLDPLRDREDFKKLLAELETSKPPAIK